MTINVLATDNVGIESAGGSRSGSTMFPPSSIWTLGNVRERQKEGQKVYCSESFDPWADATGDLSDVGNLAVFRALVWDEGNDANQSVIHLAGTEPGSVTLYVQQRELGHRV